MNTQPKNKKQKKSLNIKLKKLKDNTNIFKLKKEKNNSKLK